MAMLTAATGGRIDAGNLSLELSGTEDLDVYSEMTHRDRWFSPLHLRVSARRAIAPSASLVASVDGALRRAVPPFDGTEDLAKFLNLDAQFFGARAPAISLSVSPPVDLIVDATSLSKDTLTATVRAHQNLDLSRVDLAVRAVPGQGLASRQQVASSIVWGEPEGYLRTGKASISLPNSDSVLAMLSLNAFDVRRHWVVDPPKARNARFLAINQFDVDLRKLKEALLDASESRKFEQAVGALLYMLGFSTAAPIESDAPDLVATTPAGQSVIVECTLKIADFANKVGKLVERRTALSKALAAANLPATVIAVLACRLPRDEIAASTKSLREFNVLLLAAEDLSSFLLRARFLSDPDALLNEAIATLSSTGALD